MKRIFKEYWLVIVGSIIMAFGTSTFLLPNKLSTGGFTGLATIFYYYFKISMSTTIIVLNLPLFVIAYFKIRKRIFDKNNFCNSVLFRNDRFYDYYTTIYR